MSPAVLCISLATSDAEQLAAHLGSGLAGVYRSCETPTLADVARTLASLLGGLTLPGDTPVPAAVVVPAGTTGLRAWVVDLSSSPG